MKTHLSGIIPIANHESLHKVSFPSLLLPVADGFNLIQRSVHECAMAGCDTIWIVANQDLSPLVREVVGDWVYDPVYYKRDFATKFYSDLRKEVPIYYVGIKPKDFDRRDSYGWSVLEGVHAAYMTSYKISKWIVPDKYFVSFPFGITEPEQIRKLRKQISDKDKNFFYSFNNLTVKDNLPLPFTLTGEEYIKCRRAINKKTTREFLPPLPNQKYPSQKLPLEERWSARKFDFSEVFEHVDAKYSHTHDLEWFYDASDWGSYTDYIKSDYEVKTPFEDLTRARKHVKIPYTSEE
ncbi:MAG: hypothetical protein CMF52_03185 [Legionellales bacterium]|nr:hypothetical protein [Legionellales bacterium]